MDWRAWLEQAVSVFASRADAPWFNYPGVEFDSRIPEWRGRGEALSGRSILVLSEWGYGDVLLFVRYVSLLAARGARVLFWPYPPQARLFRELLPGVAIVDSSAGADLQVPLLSIPGRLGPGSAFAVPIPYLSRPPDRRSSDKSVLRVGLAWSIENPTNCFAPYRSMRLARLVPLFRVPSLSWFSLQLGRGREELGHSGLPITDLGAEIRDFYDCAALLCGLDLLIAVDTAPAYLAGALGLPVWLILPSGDGWSAGPDWRWNPPFGASTLWFPSMRIFRSRELNSAKSKDDLVRQLAQALRRLVEGKGKVSADGSVAG